jgi:hypothetical protein
MKRQDLRSSDSVCVLSDPPLPELGGGNLMGEEQDNIDESVVQLYEPYVEAGGDVWYESITSAFLHEPSQIPL